MNQSEVDFRPILVRIDDEGWAISIWSMRDHKVLHFTNANILSIDTFNGSVKFSGNSKIKSPESSVFILIVSIMKISFRIESLFSKVVVFGIGFLLFLYLSLNIGMVCGLLPVVGAPLPLISYGGTSLLTVLIGIGIILSISVHNNKTQ